MSVAARVPGGLYQLKTQGGAVPRQVRLLPCLPPRTTFPSHRCTFWLLYRPSPRRAAHSSFLRGESGTLTRTINHPREVPFSSPISYLLALERRHGRESSLVTVDVANVIQHSKQRGCCACERARARVCFFFFSFLFFFLVGSGGEGGGGGERAAIWNACVYVSFVTRYLWLTTGSVSPVRTTLQLRPKFF